MNRKAVSVYLAIILGVSCIPGKEEVHRYDTKALTRWHLMGHGTAEVTEEGYLKLSEGPDSKGVVLVSPDVFGEQVEIEFDVKPLQYEGVCLVFLSMATLEGGVDFKVPGDFTGEFGYFTDGDIRNYTFAFHTGYHQPNAFIRRNPGSKEIGQVEDVCVDQKWYHVAIGRSGARLWLKVDGKTVLEEIDTDSTPLGKGKIGLRLRGPGDGSYSTIYRNLMVREKI